MRAINEKFLEDFLEEKKDGSQGRLFPVLDIVQRDDTLNMELRGTSVIIYYRGGKVLEVRWNHGDVKLLFNGAYENLSHREYAPEILSEKREAFFLDVARMKQKIDFHFGETAGGENGKNSYEREFEQMLVRENNGIRSTDYFILDTEYTMSGRSDMRFDFVAVEWPSRAADHKNTDGLKLVMGEMKYLDAAIGDRPKSPGICKHIVDYATFCDSRELVENTCADMEKVFSQKRRLGLLPGYTWSDKDITISRETPQMLIVMANRDPDSTVFRGQCSKLKERFLGQKQIFERVFIAESSDLGYGLFKYHKEKCRFLSLLEMIDERRTE